MKRLAALGVAATLCAPAVFAATPTELEQRLDALSATVDALKAEVNALKAQNEALAAQQEGRPATAAGATGVAAAAAPAPSAGNGDPGYSLIDSAHQGGISLFGYGEIAYSHYDHDSSATQADLHRAVFGIGYRFDADTHFASEFEVEHAVSSADDSGEFEVEQFYIDHRVNAYANVKAGLFLIPSGLLNESHEPTRYYGVERNFVETAIIPSTWREGGVAAYGTALGGLTWEFGVTTGPDISAWDFSEEGEGQESPFGSIHQELQNAKAADLAQYLALNWNGMPGVNLGASVFTSKLDQNQAGVVGHPRGTLWEGHARFTPGPWDFSAVYAQGDISDTKGFNAANLGAAMPIPKEFFGWYLQGAVKAWAHGTYTLAPFVRYERFNTGDKYSLPALPDGVAAPDLETERVATFGASFFLNPNIVLKADYQDFRDNDANRFNLGIGLDF